MRGYMYILKCKDGSYYVGSTDNLRLRIEEHNRGEGWGRKKKEALIKGNTNSLKKLSERASSSRGPSSASGTPVITYRSGDLNSPIIENPLKNERASGHFRIIDKKARSEIYLATRVQVEPLPLG